MDDHQLLKRCFQGDPDAREKLVRKFSNLIYSTIGGTLKSKNASLRQLDIADLHNTVFVRLFDQDCRKLRQYKGENGCSLASWIRMITVRAVLDHLRQIKDVLTRPDKLVSLELLRDMPNPAASALEVLQIKEQRHMVEKAIQTLSPRDQLIIRMHCLEGCSLQQMTQLLKISANNVHSVKHRAIQRLKEEIKQQLQQ